MVNAALAESRTDIGTLDVHDHACWVLGASGHSAGCDGAGRDGAGRDERDQLTRYLTAGLVRGQRVAFYGAPVDRVETVRVDLAGAGVPVTELTARGQLILEAAEDVYLDHRSFDPQAQLRCYVAAIHGAVEAGYQGLRVAADAVPLPAGSPAWRTWPGYEFGADLLAARMPFSALCIYHSEQWPSQQLALIEAVHARHVRQRPPVTGTGFRLHAGRDGSIRLYGELDLTYARQLAEIFAEAESHSAANVLDLADLSFVDVAGVRAIHGACQRMVRAHGSATIRGASPAFLRIWQLGGFDRLDPAIMVRSGGAR